MAQIFHKLTQRLLFILLLTGTLQAAESTMAIVSAGVQQSEDAAFVSKEYQFMPGDFIYVTFQLSGFAVKTDEEKELRSIALTYTLTPADAAETALAEPVSGEIRTELSKEDRNWTPKRRASFLIPSFVAAGDFHIHLVAHDLIGSTETAKDIPFRIGGVEVQHTDSIAVENVAFSRDESDASPLEVAAYRPGDTVYCTFDMAGFKLEAKKYHVAYGVTVLRPDGKHFLDEPNAAQLEASSFYPAKFLPGSVNVITSTKSQKGQYLLILTVRDLLGNQTAVSKQAFTLE